MNTKNKLNMTITKMWKEERVSFISNIVSNKKPDAIIKKKQIYFAKSFFTKVRDLWRQEE